MNKQAYVEGSVEKLSEYGITKESMGIIPFQALLYALLGGASHGALGGFAAHQGGAGLGGILKNILGHGALGAGLGGGVGAVSGALQKGLLGIGRRDDFS